MSFRNFLRLFHFFFGYSAVFRIFRDFQYFFRIIEYFWKFKIILGVFGIFLNFFQFFLVFRIARYFWYFSKFLSVCFLDYWDFWDLSSSLNFFSDFPGFLRRSWFLRQKNRFFDCSWKKSRIWTFSFSNIAYFSILNIFSTKKKSI